MLLVLSFIFLSNSFFAIIYVAMGGVIANAQPGSWLDAFFFSVQTMATVGYGVMAPVGPWANLVASIESIYGLLTFALVAGLVFAKFSKPTAKIIFSNTAVITKRNGQDVLLFRMVNERENQILEGNLNVSVMMTEKTLEGDTLRIFHDVPLVRARTPIFALTFTAAHLINEKSPFYEKSAADLEAKEIELIIIFSGVDEVFSQTIYARHSYILDEIQWHHRFADILNVSDNGRRSIDFTKFHLTEPRSY